MAIRIDDLQFEGLKIYQEEDGYCFTSDSVLLANYAKFLAGAKVVEFCAGSGVISILLSKKQKPKVIHAFEVMKEPYDLFVQSIAMNQLEEIVKPVNEPLEKAVSMLGVGYADVVVCNPPYYETDKEEEQSIKNVATKEILTNLDSVVMNASNLLKYGGRLFMVHRVDRMVDIFCTLRKYKLEPKKLNVIYPKKDYEPVVFLVEAKKGGKAGIRVSKVTYADQLNKA